MFAGLTLAKLSPGLFALVNSLGQTVAEIHAPNRPQAMQAAIDWLADGGRRDLTLQTEDHTLSYTYAA